MLLGTNYYSTLSHRQITLRKGECNFLRHFAPENCPTINLPPPLHPSKNKWSASNRQTSIFDLFSSSSVSRSLDDVSFGVNGDETFSVLLFWFGCGDSSSVEPPYMSSSLTFSFGLSDRKNQKKELALD